MTVRAITIAAAIAAALPLSASAQEEWASRQSAGWIQDTASPGPSAAAGTATAAFPQRAALINEGYTPVEGAGSARRSASMDGVQDGAAAMRHARNPDSDRLYAGN